eukprot:COSAG01_NODE_4771_length_4754_cov_4.582814_8_plen_91_part_01
MLCCLVLQPARATRVSTSSCIAGDPSPAVMQRSMAVDRDEETAQPGTGYRDKVSRAYLANFLAKSHPTNILEMALRILLSLAYVDCYYSCD